jgi:hypothetical protein
VTVANFRRNKTRKQVRCTLCTPNRWRGNSAGRFREKEEAERQLTDPSRVAPTTKTKSAKKNWSRNKWIRSLRTRLAHLRDKKAEYERRPHHAPARIWQRVSDLYDQEIESCKRKLVELGEVV